jgi:uncharacterized lipoprotein YmbA
MRRPSPWPVRVGLACLGLTACVRVGPQQESPWRLFTLSSLPETTPSRAISSSAPAHPVLGVGPIHLPGYLDQQQIVTRISENGFTLSDSDRWAEPLEENIAQVLAQNLATMLQTDQVILYPWPGQRRPTYQLEIHLSSFDTDTAGTAQLEARWLLREVAGRETIAEKEAHHAATAAGASTEQTVAALSKALADFSVGVAGVIRELVQTTPQS